MGFFRTIETIGLYILLAMVFGIPTYLFLSHKLGAKYRRALFGKTFIKEQTLNIPLEGNFPAAATIAKYMYKSGDEDIHRSATGAYYLKWLDEGIITVGKYEGEECFVLTPKNPFKDPIEKKLYAFALKAAPDSIHLSQHQLGGYAYQHHNQVVSADDYVDQGLKWFKERLYLDKEGTFSPILYPEGKAEAIKVIELKNYLEAASKGKAALPPAGAPVTVYMRYALLFGCEDALCTAWQPLLPQDFAHNLQLCKRFIDHMFIQSSIAFDRENGLDD